MSNPNVYAVGGAVQSSGGIYLERKADMELLDACRAGRYAYILTTRQVGKSSLMIRTAKMLTAEGVRCAIVDLSRFGVNVTEEQWYMSLIATIERQLMLDTDAIAWWQLNSKLTITERLARFFQEVVLSEVTGHVVIFVDEIDTTRSLPFIADDFYIAIRSVFNTRDQTPEFQRLSFVLIGVATPNDLIQDALRTPFNIGQRVELTDFTLEESMPLAAGLGGQGHKSRKMLERVLHWTAGHPYLTLKLCRSIVESKQDNWSEENIDQLVADTFFGEDSDQDTNLQYVSSMLTKRAPNLEKVLSTYRRVLRGFRPVKDEEPSLIKNHLKLSGVVCRKRASLRIRNRIYRAIFDQAWVKEHFPVNWPKRIAYALTALMLVTLIGWVPLGVYAWNRKDEAEKALASKAASEGELVKVNERLKKQNVELTAAKEGLRQAFDKLNENNNALILETDEKQKALKAALVAKQEAQQKSKEAEAAKNKEEIARRLADVSAEHARQAEIAAISERDDARRRAEIDEMFREGFQFEVSGKSALAVDKYKAALGLYQNIQEKSGELTTLVHLAMAYKSLKKWAEANSAYEGAARIYQNSANKTGEATMLAFMGNNYSDNIHDFNKAIQFYQDAQKIYQENNDKRETEMLEVIGKINYELKNKEKAADAYSLASNVYERNGEKDRQALLLESAGDVYASSLPHILETNQDEDDFAFEDSDPESSGKGGQMKEDPIKQKEHHKVAIGYYGKAKDIYKDTSNLADEARVCLKAAKLFIDSDDKEKALGLYHEARSSYQKAGNINKELEIVKLIGQFYKDSNNKQGLEEFSKSVEDSFGGYARAAAKSGDYRRQATMLNNIADFYGSLPASQKAKSFYEDARRLFQKAGNRSEEAAVLRSIAALYVAENRPEAVKFFTEARFIISRAHDRFNIEDLRKEIQKALTPPAYKQIVDEFLKAELASARNDQAKVGDVYTLYAVISEALEAKSLALQHAMQAQEAYANAGKVSEAAYSLLYLSELKDGTKEAAESINSALSLFRGNKDRAGECSGLLDLGLYYYRQKLYPQAADGFNGAIQVCHDTQDSLNEAYAYFALGEALDHSATDPQSKQKAIDNLEHAADLYNKVKNFVWSRGIYYRLSQIYKGMGNQQKAAEADRKMNELQKDNN
jgi:tetratricopeptide (TPR) repeat protein